MPSHEEHCQDSLRKYRKRFDDLHWWMDEPSQSRGKKHREERHDPYATPHEAKEKFGENADKACLDHIRLDQLVSEQIRARLMDTDFCVHWRGDAKARWCRYCGYAMKAGQPCFDLWEIVRRMATMPLTFMNTRKGKAFGNRYRLESPSYERCYLKMLQGRGSQFALPKEDFLYVVKTGRGGVNETPSKTRQNPFVDLLVEIVANNTNIPEGSKVINDVIAIPRKSHQYAMHGKTKQGEYAGICPKCGSPLVWRKAGLTGELYRGCTNYDGGCRYQERSYERTPRDLEHQEISYTNEKPFYYNDMLRGPDDSHFWGAPPIRETERCKEAKLENRTWKKKIKKRLHI